jgi:hypothetical protein
MTKVTEKCVDIGKATANNVVDYKKHMKRLHPKPYVVDDCPTKPELVHDKSSLTEVIQAAVGAAFTDEFKDSVKEVVWDAIKPQLEEQIPEDTPGFVKDKMIKKLKSTVDGLVDDAIDKAIEEVIKTIENRGKDGDGGDAPEAKEGDGYKKGDDEQKDKGGDYD